MKQLQKIPSNATEVCNSFYINEEMREVLLPGISSVDLLEQLLNKRLYSQAITFLAYGLPIREGIWWAYLAVSSHIVENNPAVANVLKLVKQWVHSPIENLQIAIRTNLNDLVEGSPISELAKATIDATHAKDHIAAAAHLVVVHENAGDIFPDVTFKRYFTMIKQGIDIANGGDGAPLL